jgi:glycerophosphoryl diester phosphodiesterase
MPRLELPKENTLAALEYSLSHGCDGFEFDVRYTCDRRSVLWHDPKIGRREIAATEHANLWRGFIDRRHAPMACLEDVLQGFGDRAFLDIEIKAAGNEDDVAQQVKAHPPSRGYVVSSFLPEVLLRLHELEETILLGYICKDAPEMEQWRDLPIAVFLPHYRLVSQPMVDEAHSRNLRLITWTVNRQSDMLRLANLGVDGLISDDPKLLKSTFL